MKQKDVPSLNLSDRLQSKTFANGLCVHVYPNHRAPTFAAQAWIATGSIHEEEFLGCGLSHFLEHMVFNGTEKYADGDKLKGAAQKLGLMLNAYTSFSKTVYLASGGSQYAKEGLDLLAEMIGTPTFPEDAFKKEKDIILREYAMGEDNVDGKLFHHAMRDLFKSSPLRIPVIGTRDGISSVTRDMMIEYYRRRYSPHRCHVVVAGDVEPDRIFDFLEKKLSAWTRYNEQEPVLAVEKPRIWPSASQEYVEDPQWGCIFSFLTDGCGTEDSLHANVLGALLGGYDSALLTEELQIRKGIVLHAAGYAYAVPENGCMQLQLRATPENRTAALDGTRRILTNLCEQGITEQQKLRLIRNMETTALKITQSNDELASAIGSAMQTHGSVVPLELYTKRIQELSCEDIRKAAEKIIGSAPETLTQIIPKSVKKTSVECKPLQPFKTQQLSLPDGKKLLLTSDAESPFAGIVMYLRGGKTYESSETAGYASLLSECLYCGAGKYDEETFKRTLDDYSIDLDVSAATGNIRISMECLKKDLPVALDLLISMMSSPVFPSKAVEREKKCLIADIEQDNLQPVAAAIDMAASVFFNPASPYSRVSADTMKSVAKATPEKLRKYMKDIVLTLKNASFGAYGSLTKKEALGIYGKILNDILWNTGNLPIPKAKPHQDTPGKAAIRPKEQTIAMYLMPCPAENDKARFFSLQILNAVNSGLGSFIFNEIREKRGLAYYAAIVPFILPGDGMMIFYAGIKDNVVKETFNVYESIRKRFAEKGITSKQFEAAKIHLRNVYSKLMENCASWTDTCVRNEYRGFGAGYPAEAMEKIKTATLASVNQEIKRIFSSRERKWVIVSPMEFHGSPFSK